MPKRILAITVLAASGVIVSAYLLTIHWGWWQAVCLGVGDCESVNTSRYSELLRVPVALLGALTYFAIIAACALIAQKIYADYALIAIFFLAATGVAFSAYLTYIELFVLRALCPWCVLSAILITLIAGLSAMELRGVSM
jgi:uncharacterized membrane protein